MQLGTHANSAALRTALLQWCFSPRNFGRVQRPPGLHTTAREPKRARMSVPGFRNTTKIQRVDTQRDRKRAKWWRERKKKKRNFGRSGEGGSSVRWSGAGWSRDPNQQQPQQPQPQQHQHRQKWSGGQTQNKCGRKRGGGRRRRAKGARMVGSRRVGPKGSGLLSPGLGFGYGRVRGPGLNASLWVWGLGFLGSEKFDQNTKTLK